MPYILINDNPFSTAVVRTVKMATSTIDLIPDDNGNGYFTGYVYVENVPKEATVEVWHVASRQYVKSTTSDLTGLFYVGGIKEGEAYDLIAIDPDGAWEKKVSSNRLPAILP